MIDAIANATVMAWTPDAHLQIREFFTDNVRILCLSAVSNSVPMWSYYAEAHAGLALKFRATIDTHNLVTNAKPILYQTKTPSILSEQRALEIFVGEREMGFKPSELIDLLILTKAENWEHEREHRIVEFGRGSDGMPYKDWQFEPDELEAIVLGCKMHESARMEIIDIAKRNYPQARILEAWPAEDFKLQVRPLR